MEINYFAFIFLLILLVNGISDARIISNSEHPAKLTARHSNIELKYNEKEEKKDFWLEKGRDFVDNQLKLKEIKTKAKNVIFFIGDGMSLATLAASRVLQGGEEQSLSFEKFPYTGLAKTYCINKIVPDSASTSTAYLTGVKANYGTIGVNGNARRKNCTDALNASYHTESIGKWALTAQKRIGFVTTTRVTHASPAGLYAHVVERNWENDAEVKLNCQQENKQIPDIARQLIEGDVGSKMTVILGGGRREFLDANLKGEMKSDKNKRNDGRNLIEEWKNGGITLKENRRYVSKRDELLNVTASETDRLLGLFNADHLNYKKIDVDNEPTLEEMTRKAIEMLENKNENGYFLFVEGGLIDVAHHGTYAQIAFNETLEFSKAIKTARDMTNIEDTLIVVSSDHSHTMSMAGYPDRHNSIFSKAGVSDRDDIPFLTINYANGKAANKYIEKKKNSRKNPLEVLDISNPKARFPATTYLKTETHGGEDVAVFASGPFAYLFTGVYEQNVLPHLMAHAAKIGKEIKDC